MSTSIGPDELLRDPPRRPRFRRGAAASVALMLAVTGIGASVAATKVTETNPGQLTAVGPVNPEFGFPAWYEDKAGTRLELCTDGSDPLCALAPEPETPFDPTQPTVLPGNFPHEAFYMLAGSEMDLPGGGSAVLTLALEAAFANEVKHGDQIVFARQRLVVKEGPANSTLSFQHPYGTIEVDTDGAGDAKLVEDIAPAVGNFDTPLGSNLGPFLMWDEGAPEGYLGNPDVEHRVVGSPLGADRNKFTVSGTNSATGEAVTATTDLFTVMGKIASNHGVKAEHAVVNDGYIDVFATSRGDQLQVDGQEGVLETTPMEKEDGDSERAYARIKLNGAAPSTVTVTNLGDDPQSSSTVNVTDLSVSTAATYDGTSLAVTAKSTSTTAPTVEGFGNLTAGAAGTYEGSFATVAPPASVTVSTSDTSKVTVPVVVTGGEATPTGLDPIEPTEGNGTVTETEGGDGTGTGTDGTGDGTGTGTDGTDTGTGTGSTDTGTGTGTGTGTDTGTDTTPVAVIADVADISRGQSVQLDGSGSEGADTYKWTVLGNSGATIESGANTATPTVKVPFIDISSNTEPTAPGPVEVQLEVTDADGDVSAPVKVTVGVVEDEVAVTEGRYRQGRELRVTGTAILPGSSLILSPPTSVAIYNATAGQPATKLGTAQVDTLGNWSLRLRDNIPSAAVQAVKVQSTRGGEFEYTQMAVR